MVRCNPAGGNSVNESRQRSWAPSRRAWLQMALLVFFAGVLSAAGTVAASRAPDPQGAYGPPQPPVISSSASADALTIASSWSMAPVENSVAISATATDPVQLASSVVASPRSSAPESDPTLVLHDAEPGADRLF